MSIAAVLTPVIVLVALTFALLFWMGHLRVTAVRRSEVKVKDIALGEPNWPARATQIGNAFHNQLQLPVLFYLLVVLALLTKQADYLFVVMAWLFVLSRLVHAYIFVTGNRVPRRFFVYLFGAIVLVLMWIIFAARILLGL